MYEPLRDRVLAILKVPPQPHPPAGDPASLRVFRAGRNYYRLTLFGWGIAQVFALAAIVFWAAMLLEVERIAHAEQAAAAAPATSGGVEGAAATTPPKSDAPQRIQHWRANFAKHMRAAAETNDASGRSARRSFVARGWVTAKRLAVEVALLMPPWAFPLVWVLKTLGFLVYFVQLGITYVTRRLDYEMRWYLVTDRSLRLRHGIWVVLESTMSFANIQQVVISQNPVQRLLGLANVRVQSAGGGTRDPHDHGDDMHVGYFHSVTNAEEIRDLILDRLRRFRESGLGDPEEKLHPAPLAPATYPLLESARELAAEAKALRAALAR